MSVTEKELLEALKSITRILEAVRHQAGLGPDQIKRLYMAKEVIAKAEGVA